MPRIFECCPRESFCRDKKGLHKKLSGSCDFSVYYHPFFEIKIADEVIFYGDHPPNEKWIIKKTGKNLIDLTRAGEAYYKGVYVCLNCFKTDHASIHGGEKCNCKEPKFVSLLDLEEKTCPKCKAGVIKSISTGLIT